MSQKIRDEIHALAVLEDLVKRVEALEAAAAEPASLESDLQEEETD